MDINLKYRPEIDGLRALAVVPVILFHAGIELFSGGFVGVDVFFVISGYLITTILIEDIENKSFSIVNFYERRARRILPALIFALLLIAFISWLILLPNEMRNVYQQLVSNSLFLSNLHYTLTWSYFETWKLPPVFLNTWSLAVEEQFYIIIPLVLLVFKNKMKTAVVIISGLTLASVLAMLWIGEVYPKANYYLLPSRFWELSVGVLIAYLMKFKSSYVTKLRKIVPAWMHIVILFAFFIVFISYSDNLPYPSAWTLPVIFLTALVIVLFDEQSLAGKFLSAKNIVYLGKISYPLYLFHFPIIILCRKLMEPLFHTWEIALLAIISTFALAAFTFHYVEYPFRNKRILKSQISLLSVAVTSLLVVALIGFMGHIRVIVPYPNQKFSELHHLTEKSPLPPGVSISNCAARNSYTECTLVEDKSTDDTTRKFLIVGDSFAANLVSPIWQIFKGEPNLSLSARITFECSYMPNGLNQWDGECGKARNYIQNLNASLVTDLIFHINFIGHLKHENEASDLESLTQLFGLLTANGIRVHVLGAREVYSIEPARVKLYPWLSEKFESKTESMTLRNFYKKWDDLGISVHERLIDLADKDAYKFYTDSGHVSYAGSLNLMSRLGIHDSSAFLSNE